jgi:hypothetical protein
MSQTEKNVTLMPSGRTIRAVELSPGQFRAIDPIPCESYGIVKLVPDGQGRFIPQIVSWGPQVELMPATLSRLGLGSVSVRLIRRLAHAGFIRVTEMSPRKHLLDLQSLVDFLTATQTGDYWTPERRRKFSLACAAIV